MAVLTQKPQRVDSPPPGQVGSAGLIYLILGVAFFLVLAARFIQEIGNVVVDDAYITLIYARNLAEGHGLVYTNGVRIEGFTDPLWVFLGAAAFKLDLAPLVLYRVVGIISGVCLIGGVWLWSREYSKVRPSLRVAPILLGAMGPMAYWAIGGLETTAFAALAFAGTFAGVKGGRWVVAAGLLFFLACLAHPDAVVLLTPTVIYVGLKARGSRAYSEPGMFLLSFAIPFAIYWVARWAYFGEFMPNTFYAKSTFSLYQPVQALEYVYLFSPLGLLMGPLLIIFGFKLGLKHDAEAKLLLAQVLCWVGYLAYTGGDFMVMFRFIVPIAPMLALLLQDSFAAIVQVPKWRTAGTAVAFLAVLSVTLGWSLDAAFLEGFQSRTSIQRDLNSLGLWLGKNTDTGDTVALSAAGGIPYFSERPALDMLGLNDRHIATHGMIHDSSAPAHKKYDAVYVLNQRPEIVVLNLIQESNQSVFGQQYASSGVKVGSLVSNDALLRQSDFWLNYTRVLIRGLKSYPVVFMRNDVAQELIAKGLIVASPVQEDLTNQRSSRP